MSVRVFNSILLSTGVLFMNFLKFIIYLTDLIDKSNDKIVQSSIFISHMLGYNNIEADNVNKHLIDLIAWL